MKYEKEFEHMYQKESVLQTAGKIYGWLLEKIKEGKPNFHTSLLKEHLIALDSFVEADDNFIKALKSVTPDVPKKRIEEPYKFRFRYEKHFSLFSNPRKEKFREKWNAYVRETMWKVF